MEAASLGERIGAGKEAEVFAFGRDVVKLYPVGTGKAAAFREGAALALVEALGLPAPRAVAVKRIDGRWGLVMERAPTLTFAAGIARDPSAMPAYIEAAARLQLQINACSGSSLPGLNARLAANVAVAQILGPIRQRRLLDGIAAMPDGDRLCHGDFHLLNVLGTPQTAVVVDWIDACSGTPAADACRSFLLMRVRAARLADDYLGAYCRRAGIEPAEVLIWLPLLAAARIAESVPMEVDHLIALADRV
ncbi:MAG TPA: phosphotransferase [Kaistia sp.]|nr:phosphotransferase [Kaistia sp.]